MAKKPDDAPAPPDPMRTEKPPGVEGGTGDVEARREANPDGVGLPNDPPKKVPLNNQNRTQHQARDELGEA